MLIMQAGSQKPDTVMCDMNARMRGSVSRCSACPQASVTCATTGPVVIKDKRRIAGPDGKEVFTDKKGFALSFQNKVLPACLLVLTILPYHVRQFVTAQITNLS